MSHEPNREPDNEQDNVLDNVLDRDAERGTAPGGTPRTAPSRETRAAERNEARVASGADAPPTDAEARNAPTEVTDEQRAHAEEMLERGAHQRGEGRIS